MPKRNNLIGKRFGCKVVLALAGHDKYYRQIWRIRCDCGHTRKSTAQGLIRANKCPFCSHKDPRPYRRKRPHEAIYNTLVQRGRHPVLIDYEQFVSFTQIHECHYCGAPVYWAKYRCKGVSTATNLDRKDNTKPYEMGNIVVCCLRCNKAKNTHFTYEEWTQLGAVIRSWRKE